MILISFFQLFPLPYYTVMNELEYALSCHELIAKCTCSFAYRRHQLWTRSTTCNAYSRASHLYRSCNCTCNRGCPRRAQSVVHFLLSERRIIKMLVLLFPPTTSTASNNCVLPHSIHYCIRYRCRRILSPLLLVLTYI